MASARENADRIVEAVLALPQKEGRRLIAIAGPPASGKTTAADLVHEQLNAQGIRAGLLPMDGFHMDNADLDALGLRARKGAPETFLREAFHALLRDLAAGKTVSAPAFDRVHDRTVAGAREIGEAEHFVVVEGNYLLLDEPGWREIAALWDFSVFFSEPLEVLEARLIQRWLDHNHAPEGAKRRVAFNDLPNAKRILEHRLPASLVLS